ncbi:hypothetical protein KY290_004967 [Solanum tuberosum]|uniref:Uncharacterized protein n=1 Tax=Solanum tuberosum TaxID=4113 RepID=A0ABQ7WCQ9_SOLTU|nr:hypothetical protein KY290_004967 [Solanum tuberosum]
MRVDGLTDGCCRTQLQVCSCCSIDEDDGSFPSILTCEGEEVAYRGRLGVARAAILLLLRWAGSKGKLKEWVS